MWLAQQALEDIPDTGRTLGSISVAALGTAVKRAAYTRDAMGRVTAYSEYAADGTTEVYSRTATYNNKSQVTEDIVTTVRSDGEFTSENDYYFDAVANGAGGWTGVTTGGTYMGGAVTRVETRNLKDDDDGSAADTRMVYDYAWGGSLSSTKTTYDSNTGSGSDALQETWYYRDGAGNLTSATIGPERARTITLVNDAEGRVLQRDEDDNVTTGPTPGDPRELHYYFNGRRVGDISNNGTSNVDYVESIKRHTAVSAGNGAFRNGAVMGSSYADFDQSYDPINGLSYEGTGSSYTVSGGETLADIAQQVWGDASLWYMIAEANGLNAGSVLIAGQILSIPNRVHNFHNNSTTWRPYNPNEALGDLSPSYARPPSNKQGCGTVGNIIAAVVAVAVAYALNAVGVPYFISAMVADAAAQGVSIAVGNQSKFNFGQVAVTGIKAYLLGPPVPGLDPGAITTNFVRAAVLDAGIQGLGRLVGLRKKFDWAQVASAGVAHAASGVISTVAGPHVGPMAARVITSAGTSVITAGARSLMTGTSFGDNLMATLPDVIASTVGGALDQAIAKGRAVNGAKAAIAGLEWLAAAEGRLSPLPGRFGATHVGRWEADPRGGKVSRRGQGYELVNKVRIVDRKRVAIVVDLEPGDPRIDQFRKRPDLYDVNPYLMVPVSSKSSSQDVSVVPIRKHTPAQVTVRRTQTSTRVGRARAASSASTANLISTGSMATLIGGGQAEFAMSAIQWTGDTISWAANGLNDGLNSVSQAYFSWADTTGAYNVNGIKHFLYAQEAVTTALHTFGGILSSVPSALVHLDRTVEQLGEGLASTARTIDRVLAQEDVPAYQVVASAWNNVGKMSGREIAQYVGTAVGTIGAFFVGPKVKYTPVGPNLGVQMATRGRTASQVVLERTGVAVDLGLTGAQYTFTPSRLTGFQNVHGRVAVEGTPIPFGTPYRQLSSSGRTALLAKVESRTITRDEWSRLRWNDRLATRRQAGVAEFWALERQSLVAGGAGTRNWSSQQMQTILSGRTPDGIIGHHRYSVSQYPQLANDPRNIFPATYGEHLNRWHGGSWSNPTHGYPLNPAYPLEF